MIEEIYYGTTWKWAVPYIPRVMLSANVVKNHKSTWIINKPWMMDSGVGGMFKGKAREFGIDRYAEILNLWKPPIAWSYDYPCEPSVRHKFRYTVKQAQERTTDNTAYLLEKYDRVNAVVQGWELEEYLEHIDQIKERGVLTEHLGIGSICRRGQDKQIASIIRAIRKNVPQWVKLHGFGVKTSILNTEAKFFFHSADTSAWSIERRYYSWSDNNQKGQVWQQKVPYLIDYVNKMETKIFKLRKQYVFEVYP